MTAERVKGIWDGAVPLAGRSHLCVFASYDVSSRVPAITFRYLEALRELGAATVFVTTSESLRDEDRERLARSCVKVVHRENVGYDFVSYKVGQREAPRETDGLPLLFTNDSILGPVAPLGAVFEKMATEPAAVWGLTDSKELGRWHLQSYFLYVPGAQRSAPWFQKFWDGVTILSNKHEIIERYELGLTDAAVGAGVPCRAVFPAAETIAAAQALGFAFQYRKMLGDPGVNTTLFMWDILLRDFAFPFIKAEILRQDRFASEALRDWPKLVPGIDAATLEALQEVEERAVWQLPKRRPRLALPAPALRAKLVSTLERRPALYERSAIGLARAKRLKELVSDLTGPSRDKGIAEVRRLLRLFASRLAGRFGWATGVDTRALYVEESKRLLETFLFSGQTLDISPVGAPVMTIVVILYNKAELTYRCLRSLAALRAEIPFQLLLIDNGSVDATAVLASRLVGVRYLKNADNLGFLKACNQARDLVETDQVLFLNNDTEVHPGSLVAASRALATEPRAGAVGARVILPGGELQEAGNIIWNDGTCVGYARGRPAFAPEALFARDVDYCSGAFLLTKTSLFRELGGFDEAYIPAYYEETDYCVRLARGGWRVIYEPRAAITHLEFGSAELSSQAFTLMERNREKFRARHAEWLAGKVAPSPAHVLAARTVPTRARKRLLMVDDRAPHVHWGAGYPRANRIVRMLLEQGYELTIACTEYFEESWADVYKDIPHTVELVPVTKKIELLRFLEERIDHYDVVWASRPRNMSLLAAALRGRGSRRFKLVYDAEAVFAERKLGEARVLGLDPTGAEQELRDEFANAKHADVIVAVSERDRARWQEETGRPTVVVGHDADPAPTARRFGERRDLLFLGSLHGLDSPNGDSLAWFMREAMPLLRQQLGADVRLRAAGFIAKDLERILARKSLRNFELLGPFDDPSPIFDAHRLMIVPTRFAAGIPQKAFDAAIHGLPTVCSPLIASQLEWTDGRECLVASTDDPSAYAASVARLYRDEELWESIRSGATRYLERYRQEHSIEKGMARLAELIRHEP